LNVHNFFYGISPPIKNGLYLPLSGQNPQKMDKDLGYKIRKMRELKGYKQAHMAEGLGIDKTSYGDIEAGKTKVTVERLKKIAELLDSTPQAIENFDDQAILSIHNNQQGGNAGYNVTQNFSLEELAKVLTDPYKQQLTIMEKLLADKDKQLASKDEEIQHLRALLKQQG
jgi:transcriptional regulator with XRE-family HTH domain